MEAEREKLIIFLLKLAIRIPSEHRLAIKIIKTYGRREREVRWIL